MSSRTRGRRNSNLLGAIDSVAYAGLVNDALKAFAEDTSYAIEMARSAATIESKRRVWRERLEARRAESEDVLSSGMDASFA